MSKLRFAIVGCGVIHSWHIQAMEALPDEVQLVAVCDEVEERAKQTAAKHGVAAYSDLETMIAGTPFDVLVVCTPSGLHAANGVKGAKAGKHIICEKPIDVSLEAADALINACKENNVKLEVISQHRYSSGMVALKGYLDEGRLGRLVYGESVTKWYRTQEYYDSGGWRGTWALDGGGALMNQGVHYVDMLRWILGPVKSVSATMGTLAHERIEVEDIVSASIEFENGAVGTLLAATSFYPGYKQGLEVYGTGGTVVIENSRLKHAHFVESAVKGPEVEDFVVKTEATPAEVTLIDAPQGASDPRAISVSGHITHYRDLMEAIETGRDTFMNGLEARNALEVILAVYESARTGQRVSLPLK